MTVLFILVLTEPGHLYTLIFLLFEGGKCLDIFFIFPDKQYYFFHVIPEYHHGNSLFFSIIKYQVVTSCFTENR